MENFGRVGPTRRRRRRLIKQQSLELRAEHRYGFRSADFERAMNALFRDGKIENVHYGRSGDERFKIAVSSGDSEE